MTDFDFYSSAKFFNRLKYIKTLQSNKLSRRKVSRELTKSSDHRDKDLKDESDDESASGTKNSRLVERKERSKWMKNEELKEGISSSLLVSSPKTPSKQRLGRERERKARVLTSTDSPKTQHELARRQSQSQLEDANFFEFESKTKKRAKSVSSVEPRAPQRVYLKNNPRSRSTAPDAKTRMAADREKLGIELFKADRYKNQQRFQRSAKHLKRALGFIGPSNLDPSESKFTTLRCLRKLAFALSRSDAKYSSAIEICQLYFCTKYQQLGGDSGEEQEESFDEFPKFDRKDFKMMLLLGELFYKSTMLEEAQEILDLLIWTSMESGDPDYPSLGCHLLGHLLLDINDPKSALAIFEREREFEKSGKGPLGLATAYHDSGVACTKLEDFSGASNFFQSLLDLSIQNGDLLEQARALGMLASVYQREGKTDKAKLALEKQDQILNECDDGVFRLNFEEELKLIQCDRLNNLGNLDMRLGNWKDSLEHYQKCLKLAFDIKDFKLRASATATAWENIGTLHLRRGQMDFVAAPLFPREVTGSGDVDLSGFSSLRLGRLDSPAEESVKAYINSIRILESFYDKLPAEKDEWRISAFEDIVKSYIPLVSAMVKVDPKIALSCTERARARALQTSVAKALEKLNLASSSIPSTPVSSVPPSRSTSPIRKSMSGRSSPPPLPPFITSPTPPSPALQLWGLPLRPDDEVITVQHCQEMCDQLGGNATILSYFVDHRHHDSNSSCLIHVFAIRKDSFSCQSLEINASEIHDHVGELLNIMRSNASTAIRENENAESGSGSGIGDLAASAPTLGTTADLHRSTISSSENVIPTAESLIHTLQETQGHLSWLYEKLFSPVLPFLPASTSDQSENLLVIVPHGLLNDVPFPALFDNNAGTYLVESWILSTASSLGVLRQQLSLPKSEPSSLNHWCVVSDPCSDLRGARKESQQVEELVNHNPSTIFTHLQGTRATLGDTLKRIPDAQVVHFAAHHVIDPTSCDQDESTTRYIQLFKRHDFHHSVPTKLLTLMSPTFSSSFFVRKISLDAQNWASQNSSTPTSTSTTIFSSQLSVGGYSGCSQQQHAADFSPSTHVPKSLFRTLSQLKPGVRLYDGVLGVRELQGVSLSAELVVLNACSSGRGVLRRGEGVCGVARAFLASGARSVICTLWPVLDKAAEQVVSRFYKQWLNDECSKARALREALLGVMNMPGGSHPLVWAPFFCLGDPR